MNAQSSEEQTGQPGFLEGVGQDLEGQRGGLPRSEAWQEQGIAVEGVCPVQEVARAGAVVG